MFEILDPFRGLTIHGLTEVDRLALLLLFSRRELRDTTPEHSYPVPESRPDGVSHTMYSVKIIGIKK